MYVKIHNSSMCNDDKLRQESSRKNVAKFPNSAVKVSQDIHNEEDIDYAQNEEIDYTQDEEEIDYTQDEMEFSDEAKEK